MKDTIESCTVLCDNLVIDSEGNPMLTDCDGDAAFLPTDIVGGFAFMNAYRRWLLSLRQQQPDLGGMAVAVGRDSIAIGGAGGDGTPGVVATGDAHHDSDWKS